MPAAGTKESRMSAPGALPIRFAIVGSGWRSAFFLRIARMLPERFHVVGLVTRSAETGRAMEAEWGIRTYRDVDALVAGTRPEFAVVSVPRNVAPASVARLVEHGVPVLTETPPGEDVAAMLELHALVERGAIIQVAEQYHLSPLLSAQLSIAASGRLGRVSQAQVAQCHDYHGVSIMRRAIGIGFEDARITASTFESPLTRGPSRAGDPVREEVVTARQTIAHFDFGDRLGIYDFAGEQYFSWIRANRLLVRGDRGEIVDRDVRYLQDYRTPMFETITRVETGVGGNLEGKFLRGLISGSEWVFRNPFLPARLSDDEIAIAELLVRMSEHVAGGPPVYSLAEAAQDHYLALLMRQAAATGEPVRSQPQAWAR
jgi:hypothetical protein